MVTDEILLIIAPATVIKTPFIAEAVFRVWTPVHARISSNLLMIKGDHNRVDTPVNRQSSTEVCLRKKGQLTACTILG